MKAPVAQLDRASGFEPEGREFESLRVRKNFFNLCSIYGEIRTKSAKPSRRSSRVALRRPVSVMRAEVKISPGAQKFDLIKVKIFAF